jgi:protein-disulfide isomerase
MLTVIPPLSDQDHVRGDPRAIVTLIEYGSYQCPRSAAIQPVVARLLNRYPTGLRHVFRHFPLKVTQPVSELVAEAAEFAASCGLFWHLHAMLFAHRDTLSFPVIFTFADRVGLPHNGLRNALATGAFAARVRHDFSRGVQGGVDGTPTFFIGGHRQPGAASLDALDAGIHAAIEGAGDGQAGRRLHG